MCSLSTQSRAAGSPGGTLDRDKIGDPSMRLWTKSPTFRSLLLPQPSAVWSYGLFGTPHAQLQDLSLPWGEKDPYSCLPCTKTTTHTAGALCPSLYLTPKPQHLSRRTKKSQAAGAMSHKGLLARAGIHPRVRCSRVRSSDQVTGQDAQTRATM